MKPSGLLGNSFTSLTGHSFGCFFLFVFGRNVQTQLGWRGNTGSEPFSGLFRDALLGSGPHSGWATGGPSLTFPEAIPVLLGIMLQFIILFLIFKALLQSDTLSPLEKIFTQDLSILFSIHLAPCLDWSTSSSQRNPYRLMLPPHDWDGDVSNEVIFSALFIPSDIIVIRVIRSWSWDC